MPVLRRDGSILTSPGYDAQTGLFLASGSVICHVPSTLHRDDARRAAKRLLEVVCDFPFKSDEHKSAWLALVLTLLARYAFDGPAPLFLVDANVRGSGKGLLCELASLVVYGCDIARMSNPRDDNEARKLITSLAIAGDPIVLIDNVVGRLGCASLDAAMTATIWKDRLLGENKIVELPLNATWCATGNNVILQGDMVRRVAHIRLDSPEEKPEERTGFKYPNIRSHVRDHRGELLGDGLTILASYCQAGRPGQSLPQWGSFEEWSDLVRQAIVWSDLADPGMTRQELAETSDSDATALSTLLESWDEIDPDYNGLTAAELLRRLQQAPDQYHDTRAAILELCPPKSGPLPSVRQLGNRFSQFRQRVLRGKFLNYVVRRGRQRAWRVVFTSPNLTPSGDSGDSDDSVSNPMRESFEEHCISEIERGVAENCVIRVTRVTKPNCDHLDPKTWVHRDGMAHCSGCDKYMARVMP